MMNIFLNKTHFMLFVMISLLFSLAACQTDQQRNTGSNILNTNGEYASNAQLTLDEQGRPLVWWIEKNPDSDENIVAYAVSKDEGESFGKPRVIPTSEGANEANGEGPPRLVVKDNGTMILVFNKPNPMPEFRFAGDVLYTQSVDRGHTWSDPEPLHTDGIESSGQGFAVLEKLPNGEVAAVWLDGRHKTEHSALYISVTDDEKGFGPDRKIGGPACQCCKNALMLDDQGNLHLAYRSLVKGTRDIMHIVSSDYGKTFSEPRKISNDNWQIAACPHNGPDLTQSGCSINAVWYTNTGDDNRGLFFASGKIGNPSFNHKILLSSNPLAKHVKVASAGSERVVAVWDEKLKSVAGDGMVSRIGLQVIKNNRSIQSAYLTSSEVQAANPSILALDEETVLIAWSQKTEKGQHIRFKKLDVDSGKNDKMALNKRR